MTARVIGREDRQPCDVGRGTLASHQGEELRQADLADEPGRPFDLAHIDRGLEQNGIGHAAADLDRTFQGKGLGKTRQTEAAPAQTNARGFCRFREAGGARIADRSLT
ncbi:MAG: hypothetical protein B7Y86_10365 [Brevundimonas subvibrioides]|uniref:Uncharacterized protein n=1 Tax=Brevundimonas subvibrioides TaxID=74313 RepID=A0A258HHT7_9CAUL|nr:MAG: hypothetical protein B7Y86_10365 [Brevundimonas subvibrioides]